MEYRRLGSAGLTVSALSLGSWVTYGPQVNVDSAAAIIKAAYDRGVNFFDNAEAYAAGKSEEIMGAALRKLGLRRESYIVSSKYFWGLNEGPNQKNTLNRKYLMQAVEGSLKRFGLEHIDLVFCHRPDPDTPIEEVVWAMSDIIASGKALYWGTSMWSAEQIREAWEIADRRNLRKPQMEQPQYNLLDRDRVEKEYLRLYEGIGLGLTTWSPLASGMLSGKYAKGVPAGSRLSLPGYEWLQAQVLKPESIKASSDLVALAAEIGATASQLAIAWCARDKRVSTVITGASRVEQVEENLKALDLLPRLTPDFLARVDAAVKPAMGFVGT
ncbi:MAG: aldo/keto reductase [Rectinemataceae bacterium]|jgi:voltage-dependent potassium channel beta subunit